MRCPHCGVNGSADDAHLGKKVRCPKCQEIFHFVEPDIVTEELAVEETGIEESAPAILEDDLVQESFSDEDLEDETSAALDGFFNDQPAEDEQTVVLESDRNEVDIDAIDDEDPATLVLDENLEDAENAIDKSEVSVADELDIDLSDDVIEEAVSESVGSLFDFEEGIKSAEDETLDIDDSLEEITGEAEMTGFSDDHAVEGDFQIEEDGELILESEEDELILDEIEIEIAEEEIESIDDEPISMRDGDSELILSDEIVEEEAAQTVINNPEETLSGQETVVAPLAETEKEKSKKPKKKKKKALPVFSMTGGLTVFGAIKEAWKLTSGAKTTVIVAVVLMAFGTVGLSAAVSYALPQVTAGMGTMATMWIENMAWIFSSFISSVFWAGLMLIGVRRVADKPISWKMIFSGFTRPVAIFFAFLFMTLMILSGFVLLILPGIYLAVGYGLTLPLILDKNMQPWEAMEVSRKAIHKVWWKVFGILVVMEIILFAAVLPAGLGLIWAVPMYIVLFGVVYRVLFNEEIEAH